MLEADDVLLENAQETGYRLCKIFQHARRLSFAERIAFSSGGTNSENGSAYTRKDSVMGGGASVSGAGGGAVSLVGSLGSIVNPAKLQDKVFSVTWDCNDKDIFYICYQDGRLKVVENHNPEQPEMTEYEVLFRQYLLQHHHGYSNNVDGGDSSSKSHQYGDNSSVTTNNEEKKHEKVIRLHWDKMVTIPSRPQEIIFLLGISKTIMYSSLPASEGDPYPQRPILSSVTRGDFPGYNYGTPILQINQQDGRITSMAVSLMGHFLASGDEYGNVRILLLQSPNEDRAALHEELAKNTSAHHVFRSSYNISKAVHKGPVFAIQWLPMITIANTQIGGNDVYHYSFVTGSADRAVRLWSLTFQFKEGITVAPLLAFDTFSTHMLCLQAFAHSPVIDLVETKRLGVNSSSADSYDPIEEEEKSQGNNADGSAGSDEDDGEDVEVYDETTGAMVVIKRSKRCKVDHQDIYIFGGTNLGTIHIWKINSKDVYEFFTQQDAVLQEEELIRQQEEDGDYLPTGGAHPILGAFTANSAPKVVIKAGPIIDDGHFLVAILQSSDVPIIHISTAPNVYEITDANFDYLKREVLVSSSDIKGKVRVYTSTTDLFPDEERRLQHRLKQQQALSDDDDSISEGPLRIETSGKRSKASGRMDDDEQNMDVEWLKQDTALMTSIRKRYNKGKDLNNPGHNTIAPFSNTNRTNLIPTFESVNPQDNRQGYSIAIHEDELHEMGHEKFVPLKEEYFNQPIVACSFSPSILSRSEYDHQFGFEDTHNRELLVCTMDGKFRIYTTDSLKVEQFDCEMIIPVGGSVYGSVNGGGGGSVFSGGISGSGAKKSLGWAADSAPDSQQQKPLTLPLSLPLQSPPAPPSHHLSPPPPPAPSTLLKNIFGNPSPSPTPPPQQRISPVPFSPSSAPSVPSVAPTSGTASRNISPVKNYAPSSSSGNEKSKFDPSDKDDGHHLPRRQPPTPSVNTSNKQEIRGHEVSVGAANSPIPPMSPAGKQFKEKAPKIAITSTIKKSDHQSSSTTAASQKNHKSITISTPIPKHVHEKLQTTNSKEMDTTATVQKKQHQSVGGKTVTTTTTTTTIINNNSSNRTYQNVQNSSINVSSSFSGGLPMPTPLAVSPTPYPNALLHRDKETSSIELDKANIKGKEKIMDELIGPIDNIPYSLNPLAQPTLHSSKVILISCYHP